MLHIFCGNRYGVNQLELEEAIEDTLAKLLGPRLRDPDAREVLFADDTRAATPPLTRVMMELQGADLFSGGEDKVVVLRSCDALPEAQMAELAQFLKHNPGHPPLLLEGEKFFREAKGKKGQTVEWDIFRKQGQVHEFPSVPEWKISEWIEKRASKHGFVLRRPEAMLFAEIAGTDTHTIEAELVKLRLFDPKAKEIKAEDLETMLSHNNPGNTFELAKTFGLGQRDAFIQQLGRLSQPKDWMGVISALYHQCALLLRHVELSQKGMVGDALAEALGITPAQYRMRQLGGQASMRSGLFLRRALIHLTECASAIVQGELSQRADLEMRLLALFPERRS